MESAHSLNLLGKSHPAAHGRRNGRYAVGLSVATLADEKRWPWD
jgi:hypothetical protein